MTSGGEIDHTVADMAITRLIRKAAVPGSIKPTVPGIALRL